jgi:hypothetical protein
MELEHAQADKPIDARTAAAAFELLARKAILERCVLNSYQRRTIGSSTPTLDTRVVDPAIARWCHDALLTLATVGAALENLGTIASVASGQSPNCSHLSPADDLVRECHSAARTLDELDAQLPWRSIDPDASDMGDMAIYKRWNALREAVRSVVHRKRH